MGRESITAVQQSASIASRVTQVAPMPTDNQKEPPGNSGATATGGDQITVNAAASRPSIGAMQRLDGLAEDLNVTARSIRETGSGLKVANDTVGKMNGELDTIIKNYPPFLLEDEGRKKILMSYVSLRKQIDALTVPPPPAPVYEKVKGMWEDLFSRNDGKVATPALSDRSSDNAVKTAANALTSTSSAISQLLTAIKASL